MNGNIIFSECSSCGQSTKHHVRAKYDRNNSIDIDKSLEENSKSPEILFVKNYMILECCGCETISFRYYEKYFRLEKIENGIPNYTDYKSIDIIYPNNQFEKLRTKSINNVPESLFFVYREIIMSFNSKLSLLCASGLRTIVEAICKEKNVTGKYLKEKIENLSKQNILSNTTSESLQGFRFIGNDALHNLAIPSEDELKIGIEIIEHVLKELYEIPSQKEQFDKIATKRVSK